MNQTSANLPDDSKPYKYEELKEGQIRLLKLYGVHAPNKDGEEAPLTGKIIVDNLLIDEQGSMECGRFERSHNDATKGLQTDQSEDIENPEYDALSYVWGGAEPRPKNGRVQRVLYIDNPRGPRSYLSISENLEAALKSFRKEVVPQGLKGDVPQGRRQALYLWVDAVCINQTNRAERSTQIRRMADIYKEASLVRIWLGNESEESQTAFDFTEKILSMEDFDKLILDAVTASQWCAFRSLLQMSWFKRRWIIQEVAFARKASVYCGALIMPWERLAASISLFADARYELRKMLRGDMKTGNNPDYLGEVDSYSAKTLVECISSMFRRSGEYVVLKNLLSLESLLTTLTPFDARDPHDSVYAIMHLSFDAQPTSHGSSSELDENPAAVSSYFDSKALNGVKERYASPRDTFSGRQHVHSPERITPPINIPSLRLSPTESEEPRGRGLQPGRLDPRGEPSRSRSRARGPSPGATRAKAEQRAESPKVKREKRFKVDYSQSMFRLSLEVMNWIVLQSESIDIICKPWVPEVLSSLQCDIYKVHAEDRIILPSWIQSLDKRTYGLDPLSNDKRYSRVAADLLVGTNNYGRKPYSACADLPVFREYRPPKLTMTNERHLRAQGFVLDIVRDLGDKASNAIIPKNWLSLTGWDNTDQDPPDAFWRTLVANRSSKDGPQQPPHHWRQACGWAFRRKHRLGDLNTELLINAVHGEPSTRILPFLERMRAVVWNRKLIKTQGFVDETRDHGPSWGPIVGLAPEDVRTGDKIVILYGCSVPVILRRHERQNKRKRQSTQELYNMSKKRRWPTNGASNTASDPVASHATSAEAMVAEPPMDVPYETYTLIGECYMHAFMDGEAFERNPDSKQDEEFILGCAEKCNCGVCSR
jgi:hypothetical protein